MKNKAPKYSLELDLAVQKLVSRWGAGRRQMFGGTGYLVRGNMLCGVWKNYLILRLGAEQTAKALAKKHVRPFDITGSAMKGWAMVDEAGVKGKALANWINLAYAFVQTLPEKK